MKQNTDPAIIAKVAVVLIIGFIFFYVIYSMLQFGSGNAQRQAQGIIEIIDKALVQCYALEGSYPTNLDYVERYGVLFDKEKYIYEYEWFGGNIKPNVYIIER